MAIYLDLDIFGRKYFASLVLWLGFFWYLK